MHCCRVFLSSLSILCLYVHPVPLDLCVSPRREPAPTGRSLLTAHFVKREVEPEPPAAVFAVSGAAKPEMKDEEAPAEARCTCKSGKDRNCAALRCDFKSCHLLRLLLFRFGQKILLWKEGSPRETDTPAVLLFFCSMFFRFHQVGWSQSSSQRSLRLANQCREMSRLCIQNIADQVCIGLLFIGNPGCV